jgi:RNA recognition motif-containing protein
VRLPAEFKRHKSGQSKGLAYVEFPDGSSAKKAIQKTDQMKIGEHTISVAISAPPPKKPALPTSTVPSRSARIKLQVPMIPRTLQVKGGTSNGESKSVVAKSNEDFRKMLLNK